MRSSRSTGFAGFVGRGKGLENPTSLLRVTMKVASSARGCLAIWERLLRR